MADNDNDNESIASKDTFAVDDDNDRNGIETRANSASSSSRKRARTPLGDDSRKRKNERERRRRQRIRDACDDLMQFIPNVERNQQPLTKEAILEKTVLYLAHLSNCEKNACDDFKPRVDRTLSSNVDENIAANEAVKNARNACGRSQTAKSSLNTIIDKIAVMNQKCKLVDSEQTDANSSGQSTLLAICYCEPVLNDSDISTVTTTTTATTTANSAAEDKVSANGAKKLSKKRAKRFAPKFK